MFDKGDCKMNDSGFAPGPKIQIRSARTKRRPLPVSEFRLVRQERILRAINSAASCLFAREGDDFNATVTESLQILGRSINADRVAIWKTYVKNNGIYASRVGAWNSPRAAEKKRDPVPEDLLVEEILPDWKMMFLEQRPVNFLGKDMEEPYRTIAKNNGVQSVLIIPVTAMGNYWGFISFCSYTVERLYSFMDEKLLCSGGALVAAAINRKETLRELIRARDEAKAGARAKRGCSGDVNVIQVYVPLRTNQARQER
jgi:transcriptional regulator with GAF, ATPase, and Fis domain